jgi:hypothetical protein
MNDPGFWLALIIPDWLGYESLVNAIRSAAEDRLVAGKKKPAAAGFSDPGNLPGLLDFGFLVLDVPAHHRVVFLQYHLVRRVLLVLVGGVEVAGAGGGYQFDQISHDAAPST